MRSEGRSVGLAWLFLAMMDTATRMKPRGRVEGAVEERQGGQNPGFVSL